MAAKRGRTLSSFGQMFASISGGSEAVVLPWITVEMLLPERTREMLIEVRAREMYLAERSKEMKILER
jgi:hypothetical protein